MVGFINFVNFIIKFSQDFLDLYVLIIMIKVEVYFLKNIFLGKKEDGKVL